jgi:CDGSH-type Zn-finger protein
MHDADADEPPLLRIRLRRNGPLVLQGPVRVEHADGTLIRTAASMALCRCGASKEMPFCDGSHRVTLFRDD